MHRQITRGSIRGTLHSKRRQDGGGIYREILWLKKGGCDFSWGKTGLAGGHGREVEKTSRSCVKGKRGRGVEGKGV